MNKQSFLEEAYSSAFKDELEKIALTKTLFKGYDIKGKTINPLNILGKRVGSSIRQYATKKLINIRDVSKGNKKTYPYIKGLTNELAKGSPDIALAGILSESAAIASVKATAGASVYLPIGSTLTTGYTALTRGNKIIKGVKQFKSSGRSIPTKLLKPKYQSLIIK